MTKEENIATLNEHLEHWKRLLSEKICDQSEGEKTIDALRNAIKALEQEPCNDAISRQGLLKAMATLDKFGCDADNKLVRYTDHFVPYVSYYDVIDCIELAWPVTPQPKMGQWIRVDKDKLRCSECEVIHLIAQYPSGKISWCPNCGAKMSEIQTGSEGSEKE